MKRLIPILIILLFLFSPVLMAQDTWLDQYPARNAFGRNNLAISDIKGSPYLDDQFRVGNVQTVDNLLYKDIPLRYNCFDDVLEFKNNDVSFELKPKDIIRRAEFGGQVFSYKEYESNGGTAKSYFAILEEGKATLCARYTIKFYEAEPIKAYADPVPARFDDLDESYYISLDNAPAKGILNNKKLIEILADKKKEMESFISKQKLSVRKVEDLKKITAYYNTL